MLYAHVATKVLSEGGSVHDGRAVTEAALLTSFVGVGNTTVSLDHHGDRIESYEVMNYVVQPDGGMGSVTVGLYNSSSQQYVAATRAVLWLGNTTLPPIDYVEGHRVAHMLFEL